MAEHHTVDPGGKGSASIQMNTRALVATNHYETNTDETSTKPRSLGAANEER